jgi:hypothetical protein
LPARRKTRIETPGYFGNWDAVRAFRDRLLEEVLEGRRTQAWYWSRVKKVARIYEHECYYRRPTDQRASAR